MREKQIAVLTSGGDTPGMNAAVRSVVRTVLTSGMGVLRVHEGYNGLLNCDVEEMNLRSISGVIHNGGTMLYTARNPEFNSSEGVQKAAENCRKLGIEGLIVIGGDGSLRGARDLTRAGIPRIGVPGTIDNDITHNEYTIGYDTVINTVMQVVDRPRDTVESHDRCSVVEVMGRHCGDITLNTGIAVGAVAILVPEQPYDFERDIYQRMQYTQRIDKRHFIIVVAKGAGCHVEELAKEIEKNTGIETRATILGHMQRGGSPSLRDRVVATQMGYHAVKLLEDGESNRVVAVQHGQIVDFDTTEALEMLRKFDTELYRIAVKVPV